MDPTPPRVPETLSAGAQSAFDAVLLRAERTRAGLVGAFFGVFTVGIALRVAVEVAAGRTEAWGAPVGVVAFLATMTAIEWALRRDATARLRARRAPSGPAAYATALVEVGAFAAGTGLAVGASDGAVVVLVALVGLSSFRMVPGATALAGVAAAAAYLALSWGGPTEPTLWAAATVAGVGVAFALLSRAVRRAAVRLAAETEARERLQAELVASQADLLASVEATQARIGRELHDGVGSHLTGLSLFARGLVRRIERGEPVAAGEMGDAAGMVDDALRQVRRLSRGLTPSEMERGGLPSALADLATAASHASGLDVVFVDGRPDGPPGGAAGPSPEAEAQLYRIAQEAVSNALRHAGAATVTVRLGADDGAATLAVEDDGRGIVRANGEGVGLRTMRHRAGLVGGALAVGGRPGGGTVVAARVPAGP